MFKKKKNRDKDKEMTVLEHLEELRRVLIISIIATFLMAAASWAFNERVLDVILAPVTGTGNKIVYIGVTEALLTKIKICIFLGFLAALPVILWQFWGFILPALRKIEKIYFTIFVVVSYLFFMAGISFGFFFVFKFAVGFLLAFGGEALTPMLTIDRYVSFAIMFLLPFGLVFELPLAVFLLAQMNLITYEFMVRRRKMVILFLVVIAAALVPSPDIITPLLMAAPMYLLYEAGAGVVKVVEWLKKRKAAKMERETEEGVAGSGLLESK
ncbi:MAG: twin-arginine translocase subunit TatC [Bacillota bacterium]